MKLLDPIYRRPRLIDEAVLQELGISPMSSLGVFYQGHKGPFGSSNTGLQLLDIEGDNPNESIVAATRVVRRRFRWPSRFIVLTDILALGCYVYDCESDAVFAVDFEGGEALLFAGKLKPEFSTLEEFLVWYFEGEF